MLIFVCWVMNLDNMPVKSLEFVPYDGGNDVRLAGYIKGSAARPHIN